MISYVVVIKLTKFTSNPISFFFPFFSTDSMWLEECQRQICSMYDSRNKVKIIPWDQGSGVHIDDIPTQLSGLAGLD